MVLGICRFVEGMAPVFSRAAWHCAWHLIQVHRMTIIDHIVEDTKSFYDNVFNILRA